MPDDGDVDDQRPGRPRQVAADDVKAVAPRPAPRARRPCASKSGSGRVGGQREREQRQPRRGAHRREVAQVDGERAVADRGRRHEAPIEVHAFDERVDGEHLEAVPLRLDDRGIVADADDEPGGRRRQLRWMRAISSRSRKRSADGGQRRLGYLA